MPHSPRRTTEQWQALINEQIQSGLSAPQFCRQRGIGYPSFSSWRKRLPAGASNSAENGPFVELTSDPITEFAAIWHVELELGAGTVLRIAKT